MWVKFSQLPSFSSRKQKYTSPGKEKDMTAGGGYFLSEPSTDKVNGFNTILNSLEVGHSSMQGYRPNMEDACIAVVLKDLPDHVFVAILDGHAGGGASEYISERLPIVLSETNQYKDYLQLDNKMRIDAVDLLSAALVQAYVDIDKQFLDYESMDGSGSTAVGAIISPSHIICASVGDSRCVVGTNNVKAISLSDDHKPQLPEEKARIEAAGGFVFMDRVNGELAMSRALGDYQYKGNTELSNDKQMVSCYPDIAIHERTVNDELLVLACDGVWDVISNVESINFLQDIILSEDEEASSESMAEALIELALSASSTDNISAVIVKLKAIEEIKKIVKNEKIEQSNSKIVAKTVTELLNGNGKKTDKQTKSKNNHTENGDDDDSEQSRNKKRKVF